LDDCNVSGFFTLLIPSPTGYEPREFLLAVFQRIAEHANDKARAVIERAESLTALGTRRTRQFRLQLIALFGGVLVVLAAISYVPIFIEATHKLPELRTKAASLTTEFDRRRKENEPNREVPQGRSYLDDFERVDLPRFDRWLTRLSDNDLHRLSESLDSEIARYSNLAKFSTLWIWGVLPLYVILLFIAIYCYRLFKKIRIFGRHKVEVGLYYKTQEFMEIIRYQRTLSSGTEFGFVPKFFSGKLTRSE